MRAAGLRQGAWRRRFAELAISCAGSYAEDEEERIRDALALLAAAPDPALIAGLVVPGRMQLDRMFASGAGASAALALFGGGSGYLLSRGGDGEHLASVVLPGAKTDVSACGDTLALALIGALSRALSETPSEARPMGSRLN